MLWNLEAESVMGAGIRITESCDRVQYDESCSA